MSTIKSKSQPFEFKQFKIAQDACTMKVGTDGILLGASVEVAGVEKILDIGCGSGLIGIMLAQRTKESVIHAVEIDEAAYLQAAGNMALSPWKKRLEAFCCSIQDYSMVTDHRYDLVVSNPPFFSGGTFSANEDRNNVRHTVKLPNGDLLMAARKLLKKNGRFCVILPYLEGLRFQEQAEQYGFHCTKMTEVVPKEGRPVERLILQFELEANELESKELVTNELVVHEADGKYTAAYVDLTKAFYRDMV